MASINISLTEEAYNYLKMLKGNEKSFSEVVLDIKHNNFKKGSKENVLRFAGCLKNLDTKKFDKVREDLNKSFEKRQEETFNDRVR
jgi:predicted CopG family antitoxin